jgi:lysophospholipase L1-like esterase
MTDGTLSPMRMMLLVLLGMLVAVPMAAQEVFLRFEKDVAAFEAADRKNPPPKGQIVFIGSSSIVDWDVSRYFPDLRIINRGLWGSALADAVRLVDRLVVPYQPRIVVVYAGDNDIDAGMTTEDVAVQFERFVRTVHLKLPQTRIVYIGIKPSPQRWATIDRMRAANLLIRAFCTRDDRVAFIDVDPAMLGWDEKPRTELYADDGLHLSPQGYQLWTMLLRPFLY